MVVLRLHDKTPVPPDPGFQKLLIGLRVLVVDDDPEARGLLEAVLLYCGALVTLVPSAPAALQAVGVITPHVVVASVEMAGDEGFRLVRELRALSGPRATPVIALAAGREQGPDRTLAAGFDAHVRKPVDPWEFCRIVAELARKA
jgi:CheY-like chemotaxis protein